MATNKQASTNDNPVYTATPIGVSEYETSWKAKFPKLVVLILAIVQILFSIIIFALEIASLAVLLYAVTAAGIWCAVVFLIAAVLLIVLTQRKGGSRKFSTIALIGQLVLLIFSFVLIGITGNYVATYGFFFFSFYSSYYTYGYSNPYETKYRLIQAELAFAILIMFSGFVYVAIYIYVTIAALWMPHKTIAARHAFA